MQSYAVCGKFTYTDYNRQVNHIAAYLDKCTVYGRVIKDDIGVKEQLDRFNEVQISELIRAASENNATNVLAMLLEYKNQHWPDLDPMAEFTLDW